MSVYHISIYPPFSLPLSLCPLHFPYPSTFWPCTYILQCSFLCSSISCQSLSLFLFHSPPIADIPHPSTTLSVTLFLLLFFWACFLFPPLNPTICPQTHAHTLFLHTLTSVSYGCLDVPVQPSWRHKTQRTHAHMHRCTHSPSYTYTFTLTTSRPTPASFSWKNKFQMCYQTDTTINRYQIDLNRHPPCEAVRSRYPITCPYFSVCVHSVAWPRTARV